MNSSGYRKFYPYSLILICLFTSLLTENIEAKCTLGQKFKYYVSKMSEVKLLFHYTDFRMMRVGAKAARTKKNSHMEVMTLAQIRLAHPVTTSQAIAKTKKRIAEVEKIKDELMTRYPLKSSEVDDLIPSIDPIQLVISKKSENPLEREYLVIQGQGRLTSLKSVLPSNYVIELEVSEIKPSLLREFLSVRKAYIKEGTLKEED